MSEPLVSIITPVYNAAPWIDACVASALSQDYRHIELILCDNGSTDGSAEKAAQYKDPRVHFICEPEKGVGHARNRALAEAKGDFFCFLDADDVLTPTGISARMKIMAEDPFCEFVDGAVAFMNADLTRVLRVYTPSFAGNPLHELAAMSDACMSGITWLIRRMPGKTYAFDTSVSHCEDLMFYLGISGSGEYHFVRDVVYRVRRGHGSASDQLAGLHHGYRQFLSRLQTTPGISPREYAAACGKVRRIMWKSYLKAGRPGKAFATWARSSRTP